MTLIKTNEIEEYGATFPERIGEMEELKSKYDLVLSDLETLWDYMKDFKPKNIEPKEQKKFAIKLFEFLGDKSEFKEFQGMFFALKDRKVESVRDYLFNYDDKRLYEKFTK